MAGPRKEAAGKGFVFLPNFIPYGQLGPYVQYLRYRLRRELRMTVWVCAWSVVVCSRTLAAPGGTVGKRSPASAGARAYRILITSFEPFAGRARNNSQAVAEEMQKIGAALGTGVELAFCRLPVLYDQAARQALSCVDQLQPDAVVSLGEASCHIRLETGASNLDDTPDLSDNAGQTRIASEIVPGGPARIGFHFPLETMYCARKPGAEMLELSHSAGAFVCNNLSYHLGLALQAREIPFTFIHVPNSFCAPAIRDPYGNAQTILALLRAALPELTEGRSLAGEAAIPGAATGQLCDTRGTPKLTQRY